MTISTEISRALRAAKARSRRAIDPRDPSSLAVRASEMAFAYRETVARSHFFDRAFKALVYNGIKGDYLEFGSHGARTITLANRAAVRHGHPAHLWAFDSFAGLPGASHGADVHPEWPEGSMSTSEATFHELCRRRGVSPERYSTVPGFYEDSLTAGDRALPTKVALAYVDCDLYSSTAEVLRFLEPRLAPGTIVAFDDYFCWTADGPSGEQQAAEEAFAPGNRWRLEPYVPFGWHGNAFVVFARD